ncbi:MAG: InlB B-repeat-containing protein, partial [Paludibacteraceae bacterium]|nr:InlB B-repeat-containing protein [Paludibacteraceae bacterium]
QNGMVTAVGVGTATITLTSSNPSFTTTKEFTVEHIQPSRMEIISSDEDSEIYEGDTCMLTVHFTPENTTMRDVEWGLRTAGDTTYVKLIPMGDSCKVIGLKEAGRIYIQAKSLGSSGRYAEYGLRINKKVLITEMSFQNTSVSMVKGETKYIQLNKTRGATETVLFKISNENVITIDEESIHTSLRNISFDIKALAAGKATITATTEESGLTATCEVTVTSNDFFTITFVNEDGTVLQTGQVREGEMPAYTGATPTKAATAEHTYTFVGWTPELVPVTTDATYTATYSANMIPEFTVNFMDWDGTSLKTEKVRQGKSATAPADPVREGYTFIGWDKDFSNVQSDLTVTAQYEKIIIYYTITFVNEDGTVLQTSQVAEGEMPVYTGETPTKQETAEFRYFFESWTPEIVPATADATYTATYTTKTRHYYIQFVNYDGAVLQASLVAYGTMPEYTGETPTKPSDQYDYVFAGWTPEVVVVTDNTIYTATFTSLVRQYTVTFLDWDGTELHVEQVEEGHDAVGPATNPTREGYTFIGWSKPITNITSNLIVIAQYEIVSAVSDIEAESKHPKKVIEGNQLIIILPDGSKYSATGQKL